MYQCGTNSSMLLNIHLIIPLKNTLKNPNPKKRKKKTEINLKTVFSRSSPMILRVTIWAVYLPLHYRHVGSHHLIKSQRKLQPDLAFVISGLGFHDSVRFGQVLQRGIHGFHRKQVRVMTRGFAPPGNWEPSQFGAKLGSRDQSALATPAPTGSLEPGPGPDIIGVFA